jgi:hypothetical protein
MYQYPQQFCRIASSFLHGSFDSLCDAIVAETSTEAEVPVEESATAADTNAISDIVEWLSR